MPRTPSFLTGPQTPNPSTDALGGSARDACPSAPSRREAEDELNQVLNEGEESPPREPDELLQARASHTFFP